MARLRGRVRQRQVVRRSGEAGRTAINIDDVTKVMATSRDEKRLREVWEGWHTISPPMRKDYARFVELVEQGREGARLRRHRRDVARQVRHAARRSSRKELDRLWDQVRPLYLELHAYVRMKLREKYGERRARERSDSGPPARQHLGAGLVEHLSARRAGRTPTPATR